jgi:hypothetical protein
MDGMDVDGVRTGDGSQSAMIQILTRIENTSFVIFTRLCDIHCRETESIAPITSSGI